MASRLRKNHTRTSAARLADASPHLFDFAVPGSCLLACTNAAWFRLRCYKLRTWQRVPGEYCRADHSRELQKNCGADDEYAGTRHGAAPVDLPSVWRKAGGRDERASGTDKRARLLTRNLTYMATQPHSPQISIKHHLLPPPSTLLIILITILLIHPSATHSSAQQSTSGAGTPHSHTHFVSSSIQQPQ